MGRFGVTDTRIDGWDERALIEGEVAILARRFSDSVIWFGAATRRWWALTRDDRGRWRLLEAAGPYDLCRLLDSERLAVFDSARPVIALCGTPPNDRPRGSRGHRRPHARDA